jgi:hypothetical protein
MDTTVARIMMVDYDPKSQFAYLSRCLDTLGAKKKCVLIGETEIPTRGRLGPYYFSDKVGNAIRQGAKAENVDAVVIGNCLGVGLEYVRCVDPEMAAKVIIVSNTPLREEEKAPYGALGIIWFSTRSDLSETVLQMLG